MALIKPSTLLNSKVSSLGSILGEKSGKFIGSALKSKLATRLEKYSQIAAGIFCLKDILAALGDVIKAHINAIFKSALGPLELLKTYIRALERLVGLFDELFGDMGPLGDLTFSFMVSTQDCAGQAAKFANCLSKVISKNLTNKVVSKIDKFTESVNITVVNEVYKVGGLLDQHVERNNKTSQNIVKQLSTMR